LLVGFDVVGFGALNVDRVFRVSGIVGREGEGFVLGSWESCGGSAANTVVGLARLGLKAGFVGKVGSDREGRLLVEDFKKEGVDTGGVVVAENGQSGVVMGFVDEEGERALYVAPGVNDTIDIKEVNTKYMENTSFLHMTSFVGETSFKSQKKLVEQLPAHVKVSFDPGMLYAKRGLNALRTIVKRAFVMLPNEIELKMLTRKGYEAGAEELISEGVKVVGVKLGKKGCFVTNGKESHMVEPFKVKVTDTTGAGDAWNAGFLYGLIKQRSLSECGTLGNFVASRCITSKGARNGLPQHSDLKQLNIGPEKS